MKRGFGTKCIKSCINFEINEWYAIQIKEEFYIVEVDEIEVRDQEIADIIINSLVERGYEVASSSVFDGMDTKICELITVYRIEQCENQI